MEQVDGGVAVQTVGYRVSLQARNLLFYNEPDDLTNNAFVVHADGQADWYNAIRGSGSVALRFDFFELGSGFSTPEAVALSLTSPHRQPDLVDPLAAEVRRLHFNEVYDVDVIGALVLPTRTFTDAYGQIQQSLGPGLMPDGSVADFSLGWAAPGFGNDTNGDGNLDVGEAYALRGAFCRCAARTASPIPIITAVPGSGMGWGVPPKKPSAVKPSALRFPLSCERAITNEFAAPKS